MAISSVANGLADLLAPYAESVNSAMASALTDEAAPATLGESMRYACLNGGKRLRPALVFLSAETVAEPKRWPADPTPAAVAVEMVHCYSLVHDDLPAMDDDTLRRGRPTCHVKFGEAMAILTGDALLTRAFEVIASGYTESARLTELIGTLASAAGAGGMIAGQVADMGLCEVPEGDAGRRYIHLRKTAALLTAAVRMGGICAGADEDQLYALEAFGENVGLAFQVADDLLDAVGSAGEIGKTPGKDARAGKRTYAGELGIEHARRLVADLTGRAGEALEPFGNRAKKLRKLAELLARRDR
ncbi:MAG: farnesyl diphosphate synthase [Planctomycetota bacterium]|nr:farnesyl diphosphate synthase [Planctomycetota bacterium]